METVDQLNLVTANELVVDEKVWFCGSLAMEGELFAKHYIPPLDIAINKGARILVGCGKGCDENVQLHCVKRGYFNVTVYIPSLTDEESFYLSDKFEKIVVDGKFKKRDRAIADACSQIIAVLSQYGGAASGTAANIISVYSKFGKCGYGLIEKLDGYNVVNLVRNYMLPFDKESQKLVAEKEGKK